MNRVVLQVPMDASLRIAAEKSAAEQGFSSLQDAVRVFLTQLADKVITLGFRRDLKVKDGELSPRAIRRYNRMIEEVRSGKVKTKSFDDVNKMTDYLNG